MSLNCSQKHTDHGLPKAKFDLKKSAYWGGSGGGIFYWFPERLALSFAYVTSLRIRSDILVDSIKITLKDGVESEASGTYGGNGGKTKTWDVPEGAEITQVEIRSGRVIDSLKFMTNTGKESPQFGGNGGTRSHYTIPKGWKLVGIFGLKGDYVDRIGFYIGYTSFK